MIRNITDTNKSTEEIQRHNKGLPKFLKCVMSNRSGKKRILQQTPIYDHPAGAIINSLPILFLS